MSTPQRLFGLAVVALAVWALACAPHAAPNSEARASAVEALASGSTEGYLQAIEPHTFRFPEDHGPHPDFKTEWWYFTGHLEAEGRRFGYQLTFFRNALAPSMPERDSAWATRQLYMGHFALSDIDGEQFQSFERFSRGAAGLAGAGDPRTGSPPFQVWIEDWKVESIGEEAFPLQLRAHHDGTALDLILDNTKPIVFQGDAGLSHKGEEPGNASYYYSLTRLTARGTVTTGGESFAVTGSSWLDREWSTSVLSDDQVGWDWFSLQLDDGRDIMIAQLRLQDGGVDPISHGSLVAADGSKRSLAYGDYRIEVLDTWRSPYGCLYPARWRFEIPDQQLQLEIRPLLANQELDVSFRYWEGAVEASGDLDGKVVSGRGYVELVGYDS